MVSKVSSFVTNGLKAFQVTVEASISRGIPDFIIIGLGDASVKESRKRIITAIGNQEIKFPSGKVIINLAPADLRKAGTSLDLAIAISILSANGELMNNIKDYAFIGELSLEGALMPVNGIVAMIEEGKKKGINLFVIPRDNAMEASIIPHIQIISCENLKEVIYKIKENDIGFNTNSGQEYYFTNKTVETLVDFKDIHGQKEAKRALEISAAGGHNILMLGSAGCGKTLLASALPGILPPLSYEECLENTNIYSLAGKLDENSPLMNKRPFRKVHSGTTLRGLTGGGKPFQIGELSLANNGVLFFDEITEADSHVLENLRDPLESKTVSITMAGISEKLSADFIFVGVGNPCKCGKYFEQDNSCTCSRSQVKSKLGKFSAPFLDRIDMQVFLRKLRVEEMKSSKKFETSKEILKRVTRARNIQKERYKELGFTTNSHLSGRYLEDFCHFDKTAFDLLIDACNSFGYSMRSHDRIIRVSRTIADLDSNENIKADHVAESLQYRCFDRLKNDF